MQILPIKVHKGRNFLAPRVITGPVAIPSNIHGMHDEADISYGTVGGALWRI
jgi:hypothetical protein